MKNRKKISGGTQFFSSKFEHIGIAGWISQTDEWWVWMNDCMIDCDQMYLEYFLFHIILASAQTDDYIKNQTMLYKIDIRFFFLNLSKKNYSKKITCGSDVWYLYFSAAQPANDIKYSIQNQCFRSLICFKCKSDLLLWIQ